MKIKDIITEIEAIGSQDYEGGKTALWQYKKHNKVALLPGGSGFTYETNLFKKNAFNYHVFIYAPDVANAVGKLTLSKYWGPKNWGNAFQVDTITVDEDYRGMGISKALYGVVLVQSKCILVAGDMQTPGGRRNWLSLASIPGCEVKGLIQLDDQDLATEDPNIHDPKDYAYSNTIDRNKEVQKRIDTLMKLGGQYEGRGGRHDDDHFFAFDVVGVTGQLAPAIKTKLSQIYGSFNETLLFARWVG